MNEDAQTLEELQAAMPIDDKVVFAPIEEFEDGNDVVIEDTIDKPLLNQDEETTDYTQSYREWAESNGIEYDEEEVIKTEADFEKKVSDYYIKKRYGNNPLLDLAEKNIDLNRVVDAYRQYDQVLSLDDKELYLRSQATNALNHYIEKNPSIKNEQDIHQKVYKQAIEYYADKVKNADDELLRGLANPIRQKYAEARDGLIPRIKSNQEAEMVQQYETYNKVRSEIKSELKKEPYFITKNDDDFVDYFEKITEINDSGTSAIVERFNNDRDFFKKVIEFAYLEENGLLEQAFTNKVLKSRKSAPKLKSMGGRSIGLRMIDTSKKH